MPLLGHEMSGSTMIMAPAVEPPAPAFPRSHSTPELLSLSSSSLDKSDPSKTLNHSHRALSAKDLPSLPGFDVPSFNSDFDLDTSLFLDGKPGTPKLPPPIAQAETAQEEPVKTTLTRTRTNSLAERPRTWLQGSKASKDSKDEVPAQRPTTSTGGKTFGIGGASLEGRKPLERSLTVTSTLASFAKRSWMSRSPSPRPKADSSENKATESDRADSNTSSIRLAKTRKRPGLTVDQAEKNRSTDSLKAAPRAFSRASSYFSKMKQKPIALGKLSTNADSDNSRASSSTSLAPPASTSTDVKTLPPISISSNTTVNEESSGEMPPQKRDALWSSFKTLDVEYKGFLAKNTAQRIVQVQSLLVPILRSTVDHALTKRLVPEDVDRRATILNKWWITVLEMLDGQAPQPVPGVDRPVLYEAAAAIMVRQEWRQTTSYFLPLVDRSPAEPARARSMTNSSGSSVNSSQAAFISESAEHNVRTMFVTNLVKQMAFVVDKLSLRHAPPSLINFAGKACAYAFFFAPGIADILIRLWGLTPDLIKRIADQFGLPRRIKRESDNITAAFPPSLAPFGWSSPKRVWDSLKMVPKLPMLVARIPWTGPWVGRWKGRDTDLFFIFTKHFHILSEQFLSPGLPLVEKARAPAFALVQAQLLAILDTTIHRQTPIDASCGPALVDSMHGADAALTLPLPPSNLMKGMAENRLIILLKDILSNNFPDHARARHTFAEAFAVVMKAGTCNTSQFNNGACFTLCDFLEEALLLYSEYEDPKTVTSYVDWPFWFDVCKKILGSFNTMSEVRMMSFIFAIWDAIAKDPQRKEALCVEWLLTEENFDAFFNHWCPMVRAYYHRLLCWRICRDTGRANEVDGKLFLLVATRLRTVWSHYLYQKQTAEGEGRFPPSTAPVLPAPGKKFMIIRQEVNTPQPGLFMGFDAFAHAFGDAEASRNDEPKTDTKKRWSILGKVLSLGGNGQNSNSSWDDEFQNARRETAESRSRFGNAPTPPSKLSRFNGTSSRSSDDSRCSSPTYEEQSFIFKFILTWQHQAAPPHHRILTRPRLPGPAQARVSSQLRGSDPSLPAPGLPAPNRQVSGSPQIGLINGARNASPMSSPVDEFPRQLSLNVAQDEVSESQTRLSEVDDEGRSPIDVKHIPMPSSSDDEADGSPEQSGDAITDPVKPVGFYTKNSVYAGRALAEWAQVVFECNNFVERRRDEGIMGLSEVEIPILGVDGFRKIGG
ncbi:hypothetical protein G7046_g1361 [Stylonectria norvegica]|nr:hypothetical protein G7046_g1361 [Stylonectria norvegica]